MARRIINRMDKRAEYEAYEASQRSKQEDEEEHDDEEEEDGEKTEAAGDDEADEVEEEQSPKKKKASKPTKPRTRTRTAKVPRLRVIWGVFSNSNQCVARYEYPKKQEAEEHASRLRTEKKQTFFVQPVKEPIEDKKDD
jgi:hypothetical protein